MGLFGSQKLAVGLDIGSGAIKIVQLKKKGGKVADYTLMALGSLDLNPEAVVDDTIIDSGAVVDAIRSIFEDQSIKAQYTGVALSGNSVIIKKVTLPAMSEEELDETIQWEAEQYIPFDIRDVNIDYHIVPRGAEGPGGEMDVLLVAAKKDKITDYTGVISQAGKIPAFVDVGAFALQNAFEINYPEELDGTLALINVGASLTSVTVLRQGASTFWRDIPLAGDKYNEAIRKELSLSYEQAEALKKGEPVEGVSAAASLPLINGVSQRIAAEIQKTLNFYLDSAGEGRIEKIFLSGGSCKVAGFDQILGERFRVPVETFNPFLRIGYNTKHFDPEYINHSAPMFAVAVGLALREVGE
ncbi:MAG TPA: type IV pilus assembly protein PilM [Acidobacteriota bacterium]